MKHQKRLHRKVDFIQFLGTAYARKRANTYGRHLWLAL